MMMLDSRVKTSNYGGKDRVFLLLYEASVVALAPLWTVAPLLVAVVCVFGSCG